MIDDKPHWYRLQALRAREEVSNRGSSPGLYKMTSVDSTASSTLTLNRNTINMQPRVNQRPWLSGSDFVVYLRFCALLSLFTIFLSLPLSHLLFTCSTQIWWTVNGMSDWTPATWHTRKAFSLVSLSLSCSLKNSIIIWSILRHEDEQINARAKNVCGILINADSTS